MRCDDSGSSDEEAGVLHRALPHPLCWEGVGAGSVGRVLKHEGAVFFVMTVAALRCVESGNAHEEGVVVHGGVLRPLCRAGAAPSVKICSFDKTGTLYLLLPLPLAH